METKKFKPGDRVTVVSKTSQNKGKNGTVINYCNGNYDNICRVKFDDGTSANLFDMSLIKEKSIFIINGMGGVGKDTFVNLIGKLVETAHISAITPIKHIAKQVGWDGGKTDKDRKFLADLKRLTIDYNDFPTKYLSEQINAFLTSVNGPTALFIDIREPEEIDKIKNKFKVKTVLVTNKNVTPVTTNDADNSVFDYHYNYEIANNGTLDDLAKTAKSFAKANHLI